MGGAYWQLRAFLQDAQWWDRERIEAWQLAKLKEMVTHAYENVPGYHSLYREAGVKPEDIASLADIRRLPFITKDLLRDNLKDFTARNIPVWQQRYVTTGGSTGIPFGFYHTEINIWMENAFIHNGWQRTGWQLDEVVAVLRGSFSGTRERVWEYDPASRQLLLSIYHLTPQTYPRYRAAVRQHRSMHLHAYPSTATLLADLILDNNDADSMAFKSILLGSENIYDWQLAKLRLAFPHAKILGWYGHTEQAILAAACENSDQYHIWPFYGLAEVLDDSDSDANEGMVGELVGTSLWSKATPFIRYRTGDLAQRGARMCPHCNRNFDLIARVDGRMQDYVITVDGGYISLTGLIFAQHFEAFGQIRNMQLYQDKAGEVVVRVVPRGAFSEQDAKEIEMKMVAAAGGGVSARVQVVDDIPRTHRGKYRFLEQRLTARYGDRE